MKTFKLILTIIITLAVSLTTMMFFDREKMSAKELEPQELYQVYLSGEKIGVIQSKAELETYINNKEEEVKKKYNIDKVYPPNELYIQKYIGYENEVVSAEDIYTIIKEKSPFTIKGYLITIKKANPIKIYVLDKDNFKKAVEKTAKAFINEEAYNLYMNDSQPEITTTGSVIENLYIDEDITTKAAYIPIDENIFTDYKELAKYLLFGTLDEPKTYIVKQGDTIDTIAFNNKLGVSEFMLVNPEFNNSNNLLYPGQQVKVGLINPLISIVVEQHAVVDQTKEYKKEIVYDRTMSYGTSYVKQAGVNGVERVTQKIKSINGEIVSAYIAGSEVLKYEVNEIIVKGSKSNAGYIPIVTDSGWYWPTKTPYMITSVYGYRWGKLHAGIDISGTGYGSPIYAIKDGIVDETGYESGYGNFIVIKHETYYSIYAHLSKIYVKKGQTVKGGFKIGAMGSTGRSTGTHLHLGLYTLNPSEKGSQSFNPLLLYK